MSRCALDLRPRDLVVLQDPRTGCVVVKQRFDSALRLNVHFHSLWPDGTFTFPSGEPRARFRPDDKPTDADIEQLAKTLRHRILRFLRKRGVIPADDADEQPDFDDPPLIATLAAASVQGKQVLGPRAGSYDDRIGRGSEDGGPFSPKRPSSSSPSTPSTTTRSPNDTFSTVASVASRGIALGRSTRTTISSPTAARSCPASRSLTSARPGARSARALRRREQRDRRDHRPSLDFTRSRGASPEHHHACSPRPARPMRGSGPCALFRSSRGGRLSTDAAERLVTKHVSTASSICPSLAEKNVTPHVLHHSAAMALREQGVDLSVIALWLGHESVETTQITPVKVTSASRGKLSSTSARLCSRAPRTTTSWEVPGGR